MGMRGVSEPWLFPQRPVARTGQSRVLSAAPRDRPEGLCARMQRVLRSVPPQPSFRGTLLHYHILQTSKTGNSWGFLLPPLNCSPLKRGESNSCFGSWGQLAIKFYDNIFNFFRNIIVVDSKKNGTVCLKYKMVHQMGLKLVLRTPDNTTQLFCLSKMSIFVFD